MKIMKSSFKTREITYIAIFTTLIAVGAKLSLPMPLIPFTMQVMFVMMSGQIGGKKIGFFSVLSYILLGVIGVPIFSSGGGISYILKPNFGYILGFLSAAYIIGLILEKKENGITIKNRLYANFIGMVLIYFCGYFYYYLLCKTYLKIDFLWFETFRNFVLIFIPKELLSCIFAAILSDKISKIIK